jgi:hypothetical protein
MIVHPVLRRRISCPSRRWTGLSGPRSRARRAVWGECNHHFHIHCILKWLESSNGREQCPMCRRQWKFKEGGQAPVAAGAIPPPEAAADAPEVEPMDDDVDVIDDASER